MRSWKPNLRMWFYLFVIFSLYEACNPPSQKVNDGIKNAKNISLKQDLKISAQNDSLLIGGFYGLAVDQNGNMYCGDWQQDKIWIFNSSGHFVDTLGGKGKGPGEFERIGGLIIRGDTLYALDNTDMRINRYLIGHDSILKSISIPQSKSNGFPRYFFVSKTGEISILYESFSFKGASGIVRTSNVLMHIWSSGKPVKDIVFKRRGGENFMAKNMRAILFVPVLPTNPLVMGPHGAFYGGLADTLRIYKYSSGGSRYPVVKTTFTGEKLTGAQMDSIIKKRGPIFGKYLKTMTPPDHWPVYDQLVIDNKGNFWVGLAGPPEKQKTWLIFNSSGERTAGKAILPAYFHLNVVKDNYAYGTTMDPNGTTAIVRYKIPNLPNKVESSDN